MRTATPTTPIIQMHQQKQMQQQQQQQQSQSGMQQQTPAQHNRAGSVGMMAPPHMQLPQFQNAQQQQQSVNIIIITICHYFSFIFFCYS